MLDLEQFRVFDTENAAPECPAAFESVRWVYLIGESSYPER
jgi:hypothetical protein